MKNILLMLGLMITSLCHSGNLGQYTTNSNGFNTHTYFYDDGKEVILIDTQFTPQLTEEFVNYVRNVTDSPITKVIVTHPNPDKFNGLGYLHRLGIKSYSSKEVADDMKVVNKYKRDFWINKMKMFTKDSYPEFNNIMYGFTKPKMTIDLKSGETITLHKLKNSGIASSQIVVKLDSTGDLIVGDLIHHKAHAWLEGPLVDNKPAPMIDSWVNALDELYTISGNTVLVYGGRGKTTTLREAVEKQKQYLIKADSITKSFVNNNKGKKLDVKEVVELFKKEFPDYSLPYMIQYSVNPLLKQHRNKSGEAE